MIYDGIIIGVVNGDGKAESANNAKIEINSDCATATNYIGGIVGQVEGSLNVSEIENAFKDVPNFDINEDKNLVDLLVEAKICSSKREAREFVSNNSISVNGDKINDLDFVVTKSTTLGDKYIVIRRGKKQYYLVKYA